MVTFASWAGNAAATREQFAALLSLREWGLGAEHPGTAQDFLGEFWRVFYIYRTD